MKPSRFNVLVTLDSGDPVVYNTASTRALEVTEPLARWLTDRSPDRAAGLGFLDQMPTLAPRGLVVPDDSDELQRPMFEYMRNRFAPQELALTLIMTRGCNLACSYCFQSGRVRRIPPMTVEVANRATRFIERQASRCKPAMIAVSLFGGEPLCNPEVCAHLVVELRALEQRLGVPLTISFGTNGSLITTLADSPVTRLATSFFTVLDGGPRTHDRVRKERSGAGSYRRILAGIKLVTSRNIRVGVRVNMNYLDGDEFIAVLDDLVDAGIEPTDRYSIALLCQKELTGCGSLDDCHRAGQDIWVSQGSPRARELVPLAQDHRLAPLLSEMGHKREHPLRPRAGGCVYSTPQGWTIDCDGSLCHCPEMLGEDDVAGTIDADGELQLTRERLDVLVSRWWRGRPCADCEYLALCGSGCPFDEVASVETCGKRAMHAHNVEQYVKNNPIPR